MDFLGQEPISKASLLEVLLLSYGFLCLVLGLHMCHYCLNNCSHCHLEGIISYFVSAELALFLMSLASLPHVQTLLFITISDCISF